MPVSATSKVIDHRPADADHAPAVADHPAQHGRLGHSVQLGLLRHPLRLPVRIAELNGFQTAWRVKESQLSGTAQLLLPEV